MADDVVSRLYVAWYRSGVVVVVFFDEPVSAPFSG